MIDITPREVGLLERELPAEELIPPLTAHLRIREVIYPEEAVAGNPVMIRVLTDCYVAWPGSCPACYMLFRRTDTGETIRVPSTGYRDLARGEESTFSITIPEMPTKDLTIEIKAIVHHIWPLPEDETDSRTITISSVYTHADFVAFYPNIGPFAPGARGKIVDWTVENAGNKYGMIYVSCYDWRGLPIGVGFARKLEPGEVESGSFSATLPTSEGTYTYSLTCWGEDEKKDAHKESWNIRVEAGAPPPPPACEQHRTRVECEAAGCYWYDGACHGMPSEEKRDPLNTFITYMEGMRPVCPIGFINDLWTGFTDTIIRITPTFRILPPIR